MDQLQINPGKKNPFCSFLNFLMKSSFVKKLVSKNFLFRPPQTTTYEFIKNLPDNPYYTIIIRNPNENKLIIPDITEECYQLNIVKKGTSTIIPLIYFKNSKCLDNHLVIYSHGNASDLSDVHNYLIQVSALYNVNFIAYDYRGYGIFKDYQTTENSTYEDLEYTISFAINYLKYDLKRIILWGYSLGTGPTIEIASRYQTLGGIIVQAPLASVMLWLDNSAKFDYAFNQNDIFCNINKIENVKCKIFMIHGKDDYTINVRHSLFLYEKYVKSKSTNDQIWLIIAEGAGHNDLHYLLNENGVPFTEKLKKFIGFVKKSNREIREIIGIKPFCQEEEMKTFFSEKEIKGLSLTYKEISLL